MENSRQWCFFGTEHQLGLLVPLEAELTFDNVLIMAATEAATVSELLNPCPNPGRVPIRGPLATATTPRIRPRGSGGGVRAQSLTGEALVAKGLI